MANRKYYPDAIYRSRTGWIYLQTGLDESAITPKEAGRLIDRLQLAIDKALSPRLIATGKRRARKGEG